MKEEPEYDSKKDDEEAKSRGRTINNIMGILSKAYNESLDSDDDEGGFKKDFLKKTLALELIKESIRIENEMMDMQLREKIEHTDRKDFSKKYSDDWSKKGSLLQHLVLKF